MEDIIRKVRKALALAYNNSNAEEAQAAFLLAQRLMAKHKLTLKEVTGPERKTKQVERKHIETKRVTWWQRELAGIIAENFRCHSFYSRGRYIGFIGLTEDVELASEVFRLADAAIRHYSSLYLARNKEHRNREYAFAVKNDYIQGFLKGLKEKFQEQIEQMSLALVLVKDPLVQEAVEQMHLKPGDPLRRTTAKDNAAFKQGYLDGKKFNRPRALLE